MNNAENINQVKQAIGQLEKSVDTCSTIMYPEDFAEYCDYAYSCIAKLRTTLQILQKQKDETIS